MNIEERLSALIKCVDGLTSDALATDLVLRALIASHPDREQVALEVEQMLSSELLDLSDVAFERRSSSAASREMARDLQEKADYWIRAIRGLR